jgi:hypothetical protein
MKSQIFVEKKKKHILATLSILHTILGFIVVASIISFSFDINSPYIDSISALVPISFITFRRCVHLDVHEFIKGDDILPEYTEDGYFFNAIQRYLFSTEIMSKTELKEFKGGDIKDVEHFCSLSDKKIIQNIFNEKIHYIVINSIIITILLTKYNLKRFIPLYLVWFFYNFSD